MPYQTGTVSTKEQLLDAIRVFLIDVAGSSQKRWEDIGANDKTLTLELYSNSDVYVHFRTVTDDRLNNNFGYKIVTGIFCTLSIGYNSSKPWNEQSESISNDYGVVDACGLYNIPNNTVYHFIASSSQNILEKYVFIIIEPESGVFHHLGMGILTSSDSFSAKSVFLTGSFGGDDYIYNISSNDYLFGSNADRYSGLPFNDYKNYGQSYIYNYDINHQQTNVLYNKGWSTFCASMPRTGRIARSNIFTENPDTYRSYLNIWYKCSPNILNSTTPIIPYQFYLERDNDYFSPFIEFNSLRYMNISDYKPLDTVDMGPVGYKGMVFPAHSKGKKSGMHGYLLAYDSV